tara:strand:- start:14726 stop:16105 length:1380 start_codon:yes stop_codon:yes gene_type:complete
MKSNKKTRVHFVGIGGIGMSGIAELMFELGYSVQGSDISINDNAIRLRKKGIKVYKGHNSSNLKNAEAIVFSSAVKKNNSEIIAAKKNKIPLVSRADMLGELMKNKKSIAVAGSHGKTTTTSLIGNILDVAGLDPTIVNGGIINRYYNNNRFGRGKWMVAEADESDGSFLKLPHQISVITNLDIEHLDFYQSKKNLMKAFETFILNLPYYGTTIICNDDKNLKILIKKINTRNIVTYSIKNKKSDVYIDRINIDKNITNFRININSKILSIKKKYNLSINTLGNHNILNASASIITALIIGIDINAIRKSLKNYIGVKRRFTFLGKRKNCSIYDDYAHHPTEIFATLSAAKNISKKIIVVFQPHRYSRTKLLMNEFIKVLSGINKLYITPTYSAGEKQISGATSKDLYKKVIRINKNSHYVVSEKKLINLLNIEISNNELLIFMGAGSITKIANNYLSK